MTSAEYEGIRAALRQRYGQMAWPMLAGVLASWVVDEHIQVERKHVEAVLRRMRDEALAEPESKP